MVHVKIVVLGLLAVVAATAADKLLGRNLSPLEQCKLIYPDKPIILCKHNHPDKWCAGVICGIKRGDEPREERIGFALNGMWCGNKKMCSNGTCIDDSNPSENNLVQSPIEQSCAPKIYDDDDLDSGEFEVTGETTPSPC